MPSYNKAKYIEAAISSIVAQSYANWELLIIDDKSTDNTLDVLARSKLDGRVSLIQNDHNIGLTATWNKGVKLARGEYVCDLDPDDLLTPESLACRLATIQKGCQAVYGNIIARTNGQDKIVRQVQRNNIVDFLVNKPASSGINSHSALYAREVFDQIGFRDHKFGTHADYEFDLRVLLNCKIRITNSVSYIYNKVENASSMCFLAQKDDTENLIKTRLEKSYLKLFLQNEMSIHHHI